MPLRALRALPIMRVVGLAQVGINLRRHALLLNVEERRRLVELARRGARRPNALAPDERDELRRLVAKLELREAAGHAAERLVPLPIPGRLLRRVTRR